MSEFYQKSYAYLVGQIDDAIQYLEELAGRERIEPARVLQAADLLKNALLTAEERYTGGDEV